MLAYFLFFVYLFSGTILLHFIIRRKIFPFTIYHTAAVVLFRVLMGCLYGWIFLQYYGGDDTWNFFIESKAETALLLRHPLLFFREFSPLYSLEKTGYHGWDACIFYIQHFERWFMIKGMAVLNLLSGKNYYVNVVWFEFLTIPGPLLLFKMLSRAFPLRAGMHFLLIFFIPSIVFWCSGIRAEAILLLSIVLLLHNGQAYTRKPGMGNTCGMLAGFAGLLLIRYQMLAIFLPAFIAYMISLRKNENNYRYFKRVYAAAAIIFLLSLFLPPAFQGSRPIRQSQEQFFRMQGNTRYALDSLKPGPVSFLKILPQAFANSVLRPYPWEGKNMMQSVSSLEVIFLLAGVLFFLLGSRSRDQVSHPLYWLFLYFGFSQLVLIGYIVPFPGAIVRYRTIPFLMLFLFFYAGNPLLQQKLRYWIFKLH
jgi:hypothetical protein